jgi:hypothetical protein
LLGLESENIAGRWHESASQIASSFEKRIARALPVLRIERLASVISTRSASSVSVIRRS